MIRRSNPGDISSIVALGIEAVQRGAYSSLAIDRAKMENVARQCISSPSNFSMVAEKDGVIGGAMCVAVHDCHFFEGKQASVVQFYCKIPGDGIGMMREFVRWANHRPIIRLKVFTLETDADPRIGLLLSRLGFSNPRAVYTDIRSTP